MSVLGKGTKIFNFVNAYGCSIDDNTKIGAFVEIQKGASSAKIAKFQVIHLFVRVCILRTMFLLVMV